MLIEKSTYPFDILKQVTLPDGTMWWVLTHDGSDRYLLPDDQYRRYGFTPGSRILCRVDKINCAGRVYLEPEHPLFREGEVYPFRFKRDERTRDEAGNHIRILYLQGKDVETHSCLDFTDRLLFEGEDVLMRVLRIKKGKLTLEPVWGDKPSHLVAGRRYPFRVLGLTERDGKRLLELEGTRGVRSFLDISDYPFLSTVTGTLIHVTLIDWTAGGAPRVEPDHPLYTPGQSYTFKMLRSQVDSDPNGGDVTVWMVEDGFGNEIKVYPGTDLKGGEIPPAKVTCTVARIKRGKPVLRVTY